EPLDPARVLTNRSTGRMGFALAEAARDRGAEVTVVAGAVNVEPPEGVEIVRVTTALQMERAMRERAPKADVIVMAAAVADYRPARPSPQKLKREAGPLTVTFEPNPDILAGIGATKTAGQLVVGFALETQNGVENARKKLAAKRADLIVLNTPEQGIGGGEQTEEQGRGTERGDAGRGALGRGAARGEKARGGRAHPRSRARAAWRCGEGRELEARRAALGDPDATRRRRAPAGRRQASAHAREGRSRKRCHP